MKNNKIFSKAKEIGNSFKNGLATGCAMGAVMGTQLVGHCADFGEVTITSSDPDASQMMGKVIGILLTITRYVGVALVIYGVYEVIMSFMQNQPEAKTKGIVMALAGVVMIALKSVLQGMGIIG
jgi:hypothetical protein